MRGRQTAKSAYKLRDRAGAEEFARSWDVAQQMAGDRAFEQAMDRAMNGVEVPRYYRGQQVGTVRRPDYRLALKVLDHHLGALHGPARFERRAAYIATRAIMAACVTFGNFGLSK